MRYMYVKGKRRRHNPYQVSKYILDQR